MTSVSAFDACMFYSDRSYQTSCVKVRNKTPVDAFQIDASLKVPIVDLNTVQSDRSLKWTFTQPIDFERISNRNISLKGLRVVKNSREIVQGIELSM